MPAGSVLPTPLHLMTCYPTPSHPTHVKGNANKDYTRDRWTPPVLSSVTTTLRHIRLRRAHEASLYHHHHSGSTKLF